MPYRVALYSPDRGVVYDGRTPEETGVGGGITARVSLLHALAALGHDVTAFVNCRERLTYRGVSYRPLDDAAAIDADVFIAMTTGDALSFAPLQQIPRRARLSIVWVQGVPQPSGLDVVQPDRVYVASAFLRDVCVQRWGVPASKLFVCYNGIDQDLHAGVDARPPARDPHAIAFVGPPSKGLDHAIAVLRRLRAADDRFRLHVFGGRALWGDAGASDDVGEPGVVMHGLVNQRELARDLAACEYALALQDIEEGFGIAVQEAKRAGAIVIASRAGALAETIRSSYDGLLVETPAANPELVSRVADLVSDLAIDPSRRERLRRHARATPWSWALAARTWTAHWDHLLDVSAAPTVSLGAGVHALVLPDGLHDERDGTYLPDVYSASPLNDRRSRQRRVLLGGYFGHGNLGDEAILQTTVAQLRDADPIMQIAVATGDCDDTRRRHDVEAIDERDPVALLDAARRSDLIMLGGGGLFHDVYGLDTNTVLSPLHWGLTHCATFPALAAIADARFAIHAAGVGPLHHPAAQSLTCVIFERADAASVRDTASHDALAMAGADVGSVRITADPVFLLPPPSAERIAAVRRRVPRPGSPCVAVALRAWGTDTESVTWQSEVAAALDRVVEGLGAAVLFVSFERSRDQLRGDVGVARAVQQGMQQAQATTFAPDDLSADDMQALFSECDLVLTMRLHGLILAANAGTPAIALSYDPKVRSTAEALGLHDQTCDVLTVTADLLAARITAAIAAAATLRPRIRSARDTLAVAAASSVPAALAVIESSLPAPAASAAWIRQISAVLAREIVTGHRAAAGVSRLQHELDDVRHALAATTAALADATDARLESVLAAAPSSAGPASSEVLRLAEQGRARDAELTTIHRSRAWRAISAYRIVRQTASAFFRRPAAVTKQVAIAAGRRVLPAPARRRLRQASSQLLMNPYAYAFDRFKRMRLRRYGASGEGIHAPGVPGLVSVVLPVYNGAAVLAQSLDSLFAQTYRNLEVIAVDDGSTDATPSILADYAAREPRLQVITQANAKLPRALNTGFARARGEFLTWTSADNRMKPDCVEKLVACLRRHSRWDMTYANLDIIGEHGEFLRGASYYEGYQRPHGSEHVHLPRVTDELNVWPNNYVGAAFLYRNRVPHLIGEYSPRRFVLEDYDYWMRVNSLLTLRHTDFDEPVYEYRFHGDSLTARWEDYNMLAQRERMMVFDEFRRDFFLSPLLWIIDGPDRAMAQRVRALAERAGHRVYGGDFRLDQLPSLWVPAVRVWCARSASDAADRGDARGALQVLLTNETALPADAGALWDLAVTTAAIESPPRLQRPWQGWLAVESDAALLQAIDARAKSEHLARLEALIEAPPPATLKATVVICTNRWAPSLRRTLDAVRAQSLPAAEFEVVIVDNATAATPAPALADLLSPGQWRADQLHVVVCPIPGLSAARNASLADARGEIVAFLDDDAVPAAEWLERLCAAFAAHPKTAVIGGHIVLEVPSPRPAAAAPGWEKYWSQFVTSHTTFTDVQHWWEFPWGANWAARRDALRSVGGFRLHYGRSGNDYWGGEELVAAALIQRLGGGIAILPGATVTHAVDPSRFSFDHVRRTVRAGHLASYQAQRDLYIPAEAGVSRTLALLAARHVDSTLPAEYRGRDFRYRKAAQVALLRQQLRDLRARRRPPAVAE